MQLSLDRTLFEVQMNHHSSSCRPIVSGWSTVSFEPSAVSFAAVSFNFLGRTALRLSFARQKRPNPLRSLCGLTSKKGRDEKYLMALTGEGCWHWTWAGHFDEENLKSAAKLPATSSQYRSGSPRRSIFQLYNWQDMIQCTIYLMFTHCRILVDVSDHFRIYHFWLAQMSTHHQKQPFHIIMFTTNRGQWRASPWISPVDFGALSDLNRSSHGWCRHQKPVEPAERRA